jgi:TRAP-type C4-dicarboxylate transport system substrate-binding protein
MRSPIRSITTAVAFTLVVAGCAGGGSSDKSGGGGAAPVTLRLGTVEGDTAFYADDVEAFVEEVERSSDGSIDVVVDWETVPWDAQSEQELATMVRDGDIDLALTPARVWDRLDVTSLRALHAPFLVDDTNLVNAIAGSDLADEMMAGLESVGVEGLAMWPEALRHPIGFTKPLLSAADFAGVKLRVPASDVSYELVRALGAVPAIADASAAAENATFDGAESALA